MTAPSPSRIERLATAWGPVIVVLVSVFGGLVTWSCNAAAERAQRDYQRREQSYTALISSLGGFHVGGPALDKAQFIDQLNLCWLYCSDQVIRDANAFLATVESGSQSKDEQRKAAMKQLVTSIRRDLILGKPVASTELGPNDFRILKPN